MLFEKPVFLAVTLTGAGAGFGSSSFFFSSSAASLSSFGAAAAGVSLSPPPPATAAMMPIRTNRATIPRHPRPTIFPVLRFFGGWGCGNGGCPYGCWP